MSAGSAYIELMFRHRAMWMRPAWTPSKRLTSNVTDLGSRNRYFQSIYHSTRVICAELAGCRHRRRRLGALRGALHGGTVLVAR